MRSEKKRNPILLNPNWTLLQQKLGIQDKQPSHGPNPGTQNSLLGKRKRVTDAAPDDPQPNPLIPINDDFRRGKSSGGWKIAINDASRCLCPSNMHVFNVTDAVAMDCEMVGVGQGNKSALGRVTLEKPLRDFMDVGTSLYYVGIKVNQWGNVLYDEFVRPMERVVDFRTRISGIRPRDLRKAKDFSDVQQKVAALIEGRILVGHALHNDLKALLLSHPKQDLRDTSEYQPFLRERTRKALRHLAMEFLGVNIQNGEHCPIEDAQAAMLLYQRNKRNWERSAKDQMRLNQKRKKHKKKKKKVKSGGTSEVDRTSTS